jgi:hypothetical protein
MELIILMIIASNESDGYICIGDKSILIVMTTIGVAAILLTTAPLVMGTGHMQNNALIATYSAMISMMMLMTLPMLMVATTIGVMTAVLLTLSLLVSMTKIRLVTIVR